MNSLDSYYSKWSKWSKCIGICHSAIRYRTRICKNIINKPCMGKSKEYEKCPNTCNKSKRDLNVYNSSSFIRDFLIEKSKEFKTGNYNQIKSNLIIQNIIIYKN